MKPLNPRTIIIAGPLGVFIAVFIPSAVLSPSQRGMLGALISATIAAMFWGLPLFGSMAWAARWSQHKPKGDLDALDKHYRMIERFLALAGMGALGYLVGCSLTFVTMIAETEYQTFFGTIVIVIVILSFVTVFIVAVAKIGIVKRLEILKSEIQSLKETDTTVSE